MLACEECNTRQGTQTAAEFGYPTVQTQAKALLKDAAAVNSMRWALYQALVASGLGSAVVDGGNPFTPVSKSIASDGTVSAGPSGWSRQ